LNLESIKNKFLKYNKTKEYNKLKFWIDYSIKIHLKLKIELLCALELKKSINLLKRTLKPCCWVGIFSMDLKHITFWDIMKSKKYVLKNRVSKENRCINLKKNNLLNYYALVF